KESLNRYWSDLKNEDPRVVSPQHIHVYDVRGYFTLGVGLPGKLADEGGY
ncbi:unnamed protein product, partial [Amoebophrya sp. A25]